ncbi:MAG: hypothetical protein R6X19_06920 [Kiritimatiellia bacterium]
MKAKKTSRAPFNLVKPSAKRLKFLDLWLKERSLDLALRDSNPPAKPATRPNTPKAPLAPKDWHVQKGDIRLLGKDCIDVPDRPLIYVAVLDVYDDDGMALVAPFSPYAAPATAGEWQTPLSAEPLRVLELWNARTVPLFRIAQSWLCQSLTKADLATAREILRHTISGEILPAKLREQTGLPVFQENDPRLAYLEEEIQLLAPLTAAAQALTESPAAPKPITSWLRTQPTALALAAATDKETRAEVYWLDQRNKPKWRGTASLVDCTPDSNGWQIDWLIENPPADLLPGLPVSVCIKHGRSWQVAHSTFTMHDKKNGCWIVAELAESARPTGQNIADGAPVRLVIVTPKDA